MAIDRDAEIAAEQDAVSRLFESLQNQADQEPEDDAVMKAVVDLLAVAFVPSTGSNREKWECRMCGGRDDDHAGVCPLPALEQWITRVP